MVVQNNMIIMSVWNNGDPFLGGCNREDHHVCMALGNNARSTRQKVAVYDYATCVTCIFQNMIVFMCLSIGKTNS